MNKTIDKYITIEFNYEKCKVHIQMDSKRG